MPKFSRPAATGGMYFWYARPFDALPRSETAPFSGSKSLHLAVDTNIHLISPSLSEITQTSTTIYDNLRLQAFTRYLYTIYHEQSEVLGTGKPR